MTHVHEFTVAPSPAQLENDDERKSCTCGHRQVVRTFTLPYIPPGSNALFQMHHQEAAGYRRQLRNDVANLLIGEPPRPLVERARITLDMRWRTRTHRDPGNYVEGCKGLIDGLVGRWLVDDDTRVEILAKGQTGTGHDDHVIVTMEEL